MEKDIGEVVAIDDITQTILVRVGKMHFIQPMPTTHYPCPERSKGSFIEDHLDLSRMWNLKFMKMYPNVGACDLCELHERCEYQSLGQHFSP